MKLEHRSVKQQRFLRDLLLLHGKLDGGIDTLLWSNSAWVDARIKLWSRQNVQWITTDACALVYRALPVRQPLWGLFWLETLPTFRFGGLPALRALRNLQRTRCALELPHPYSVEILALRGPTNARQTLLREWMEEQTNPIQWTTSSFSHVLDAWAAGMMLSRQEGVDQRFTLWTLCSTHAALSFRHGEHDALPQRLC